MQILKGTCCDVLFSCFTCSCCLVFMSHFARPTLKNPMPKEMSLTIVNFIISLFSYRLYGPLFTYMETFKDTPIVSMLLSNNSTLVPRENKTLNIECAPYLISYSSMRSQRLCFNSFYRQRFFN